MTLSDNQIADRLARLEVGTEHRDQALAHLVNWTERHGQEEKEQYGATQRQIAALAEDLGKLRSDIMMARGAVHAAAVMSGLAVVAIGAVWTLITFLAGHIPAGIK